MLSTILGCSWPSTLDDHPAMMATRADRYGSPFSHYRFQTKRHGKLLAFRTCNVIRAGKYTHGDACTAAVAFQRWMHHTTDRAAHPWITAVSTPNTVLTGQLRRPVSNTLRTHWSATHTPKFPGIAITVPGVPGVTPEVFTKAGKFIVPGVRTTADLHTALAHVAMLQAT